MMEQKILAITFLFSCWFQSLEAQWRGPLLEYFAERKGHMAQIYDIVQDSTGYIYFATDQGMYRYDGDRFQFFGHDPNKENSIASGHVVDLLVSKSNMIWIALYQSGLCKYDPYKGAFTHFPLPDFEGPNHSNANYLAEGANGEIWVAADHFRLLQFDQEAEQFKVHMPDWVRDHNRDVNYSIRRVLADRLDENKIWMTVQHLAPPGSLFNYWGIASYDIQADTFTQHPCNGKIIFQESDGSIWSSLYEAVISRYSPQNNQYDTFNFDHLQNLEEMGGKGLVAQDILPLNNEYLVASTDLLTFHPRSGFKKLIANSEEFMAHCLFRDNEENVWIGGPEGVIVYPIRNQHILFFSLSHFNAPKRLFPARLTFHSQSNAVFLAQSNNLPAERLFSISLNENALQGEEILTGFPIHGLSTDMEQNIWVVGDGRLHNYNPATKVFNPSRRLNEQIDSLPWIWNMRTQESGWIGGLGNELFFWFHPSKLEYHQITLHDLSITDPEEEFSDFTFNKEASALLVGRKVIIQLDLITREYERIILPDHFQERIDDIHYAAFDEEGKLWVLIFSTLFTFEEKEGELQLVEEFTLNDGISSPTMQELHFDAYGRIWIFSNSGMNCLDPGTREIRNFGLREGLPISFVDPRQVIDLPDNRIATVCGNGLIVFQPDELWHSKDPPVVPIVINDIRINGRSLHSDTLVQYVSRIELPKGPKVVDLQFQGLAYPTDQNVSYSYRMKEFQDEWIDIGSNRFVTLPALPYGLTTFEVKAAPPGVESPVRQLVLLVPTPLYAQWWFWPMALLFLAIIGFWLYRRRINQIKRREEEKTMINKQLAELELKALRSQMNPHFMFNSLNSIKTYIIEAKPDVAADYLSQFAHLVRRILQNSREKMISLKEEIESLQLYISLEQFRFENAFEFQYHIDQEIDIDSIQIPPMLLQPHVENAIWHGLMHKGPGGKLKLEFLRKNGNIKCIIEDNGIGREKAGEMKSLSARRHKSMGMGITQNRINLMNSIDAIGIHIEIVDMTDANGEPLGTKVIVSLPLKKDESMDT